MGFIVNKVETTKMIQLVLFENEINPIEKKLKPLISWSYSKMNIFNTCRRKYYYQYYGSKKRTALKETNKAKLIELAQLSNKSSVQGNLIHKVIGTYFKKAKIGELWDLKRLENFGIKILKDSLTHSLAIKNGQSITKSKYQQPIIKEILYNILTYNDIYSEVCENIRICFTNLFESKEFSQLMEGGKKSESHIEDDCSFILNNRIAVDGKLDIAYKDDDELIIADWKTGKHELEDTSLQLLVYALWSKNIEEYRGKNIQIKKAYLLENKVESLDFSELHIERARVRILQDSALLIEMEEYAKEAIVDAFMPCNHKKVCEFCSYEEICQTNN